MCGKETFATLVSSTSMKVASITVIAITQGLMSLRVATDRSLLRQYGGVDVHAGAEHGVAAGNRIEHDLYRDALHHFDEIACGILGWQQAEARTGGARDRIDPAGVGL